MKFKVEMIVRLSLLLIAIGCVFYLYNDPQRLFGSSQTGMHEGVIETAEQFKTDSIYAFESVIWAINDKAKENEQTSQERIVPSFYKEAIYQENKIYILLIDKTLFVQLNEDKAAFYGNDHKVKKRFNEFANKEAELLLKELKERETNSKNNPYAPNLKAGKHLFSISDIRPSKEHIWENHTGETRAIKYITGYTNPYKQFLKSNGKDVLASQLKVVQKIQ